MNKSSKELKELISEFDKELYEDYYPCEKSKKLIEIHNRIEDERDEELSRQIFWELNLLNKTVSFHPEIDVPDRWKWYEEQIFKPLPFWEKEAVPYFRRRTKECNNILNLARYHYFLWIFEKNIDDIFKSATLFLETANKYVENRWYSKSYQLTPFLFRLSARIWKSLNKERDLKKCLEDILLAIKIEYDDGDRRWLLDLCEITIMYTTFLEEGQVERLINTSNKCATYHENQGNYHMAQSFLYMLSDIYTGLKKDAERKLVLQKIAKLFELEAERRSDSNLVKVKFLEDAMKIYAEIGDTKKKDELKNAISSLDTIKELKKIGTEFKINFKDFDKHIDNLVSRYDGEAILYISGKDPAYTPSLRESKNRVEQFKKDFPIQFLFPISVVNEYGNKIEISGDENIEEYKIKEQLIFSSNFNQIFISRLFDKLMLVDKLNIEIFEKFMISCQFPLESIKILKEAFLNYNEMRYASAISLMVPQIEKIIQIIYQLNKIPIISIRSSGFQTTILSGLLSHPKANDILGEDFTFYMKCFLIDQTSMNIRNRVCHGNLNYDAYSKPLTDSILYAIVRLGTILYDKMAENQKNDCR